MRNPLKPMRWLMSTNPRNKAKFHAWRYYTLGPGLMNTLGGRVASAYNILDSIDGRLLSVDWPQLNAGLGIVAADMSSKGYVAFMIPYTMPKTELEARALVSQQENEVIERVANYFEPEPSSYGGRVYRESLPRAYKKFMRIEQSWREIRAERESERG